MDREYLTPNDSGFTVYLWYLWCGPYLRILPYMRNAILLLLAAQLVHAENWVSSQDLATSN